MRSRISLGYPSSISVERRPFSRFKAVDINLRLNKVQPTLQVHIQLIVNGLFQSCNFLRQQGHLRVDDLDLIPIAYWIKQDLNRTACHDILAGHLQLLPVHLPLLISYCLGPPDPSGDLAPLVDPGVTICHDSDHEVEDYDAGDDDPDQGYDHPPERRFGTEQSVFVFVVHQNHPEDSKEGSYDVEGAVFARSAPFTAFRCCSPVGGIC